LTSSEDKKATVATEDTDAESNWLFNLTGSDTAKALAKAKGGFSWEGKAKDHTNEKSDVVKSFTEFTGLGDDKKTHFQGVSGKVVKKSDELEAELEALNKNETELVIVDISVIEKIEKVPAPKVETKEPAKETKEADKKTETAPADPKKK